MTGYKHGCTAELAAARTIYEKAKIQAQRIIADANEKAVQIISAARVTAERDANLIREKARTEGLAQADAQLLEAKRRDKEQAQARLRAVTAEATGHGRLRKTA